MQTLGSGGAHRDIQPPVRGIRDHAAEKGSHSESVLMGCRMPGDCVMRAVGEATKPQARLHLLAVPTAEHLWGSGGVLGSAAVLGLTDMDALTYSMSRLGATRATRLSPPAPSRSDCSRTPSSSLVWLSLWGPRGSGDPLPPGFWPLPSACWQDC
jgi:hypothetical protein